MEHQDKGKKVVVLGSASGDVFFLLDRIPQIGETLDASGVERAFGGKGANQALQVGRLGGEVEMLVQLGNDETGKGIMQYFKDSNVGTTYAKLFDGIDTGQAYIMSLKSGDNAIFIYGASNCHYDKDMKELDPNWSSAIAKSKILVLQREIPEFVNVIAAAHAKKVGTMTILDVGGRDEPLSHELLLNLDIVSPNETELARVINKKVQNEEELESSMQELLGKYPHLKVLLKQGENGATMYYLEENTMKKIHKPAYKFSDYPQLKLIDTTGAGDCYTGAFAFKLAEGASIEEAMQYGNKAGFLCITKFGAGPSVPYLKDIVDTFGN